MAAGVVSADSTDAINGSQLYYTNQAIANVATQATDGDRGDEDHHALHGRREVFGLGVTEVVAGVGRLAATFSTINATMAATRFTRDSAASEIGRAHV